MIIGISGYAGSGKDTVGQIIQKLTTPQPYQHEEDEFGRPARYINGEYVLKPTRSQWEIKKFAGKLKQIASLLTGIDVLRFEDQEFKKTYLGEEWSVFEPSVPLSNSEFVAGEMKLMTVRDFLRKLGTEAVRDNLHPNTWVNALFADYREGKDFWIVTDARFPNEAEVIKDKGGYLIRVNRKEAPRSDHPSETSLDSWVFDYVIDNNGTLKQLEERVWKILHLVILNEKQRVVKLKMFEEACVIRDIEKSIINLENDSD